MPSPQPTEADYNEARALHDQIMRLPSDDGVGTCPTCRLLAVTIAALKERQEARRD